MPLYVFICTDCKGSYEALAKYDQTGKYDSVECPKCHSKNKKYVPSAPAYPAGTRDRLERFDYRAGKNLEKAQGERRAAEAASHMGSDPYGSSSHDDTHYGEGITDLV